MFLQKVKVGLTSLAQRAETSKKLQSPWGPEFRKKIESSYPDILIWTFWQYWRARNRKYIFLTQLQFLARYDYYCRVSLYQEKGKGAPSDRGIRLIRMSHGKNIGFPDASSNTVTSTQWFIAIAMDFVYYKYQFN